MNTTAPNVEVREHTLTLIWQGKPILTAVATAWGWHLNRGHQPGPEVRRYIPTVRDKDRKALAWESVIEVRNTRCAWESYETRTQAIERLAHVGELLANGHLVLGGAS